VTSIYMLDDIHAGDTRRYAGGQWVNHTQSRCPGCGMWLPETEPKEIQIALNHLGRDGFVEYLWNSHTFPIFRDDLIQLWQRAGLSGFAVKPVRIVGWYDQPKKPLPADIPVYHRLVLTSQVRLSEPPPVDEGCDACGWVQYAFPKLSVRLENGMKVDERTWDGADFFGLCGYEFVFCTRRAAQVTLEAGYNRHIAFVHQEDYDRWEEFRPDAWEHKAYRKYVETFLIRDPARL